MTIKRQTKSIFQLMKQEYKEKKGGGTWKMNSSTELVLIFPYVVWCALYTPLSIYSITSHISHET